MFILVVIGLFYQSKTSGVVESKTTSKTIRVYIDGAVSESKWIELSSSSLEEAIEKIDLKDNADISCISYERILYHEDVIYIPEAGPKISLNQATVEELITLSGIGPKRAQSIIENRPYDSIESITKVSGIGEKTYLKLREYLCL